MSDDDFLAGLQAQFTSDDTAAASMMDALEGMRPIAEAVTGYRKMLQAQDWNETEAAHMAMQYHQYLMGLLYANAVRQAQ